jgi:addiction module HigA family antidote
MPDLFEIARWTARPVTPGEYLRRLLAYLDVTQEELAAALDTSRFTVNQIVTGNRTVTTAMAMRLAKATGSSIEIWLNLQRDLDLFDAYKEQREALEAIKPIRDPSPPMIIPVGTDLELLAHRLLGEALPPLERAAATIRKENSAAPFRLQVAVFGPDNLKHIGDTFGAECGEKMLRLFSAQVRDVAACLGVPAYHFGFENAAIVISSEPDRADQLLETSFAGVPTSIEYGNLNIGMSISGGIATTGTEGDVLSAAVLAAELQHNLRRYRPGNGERLWSRAFRGR